MKDDVTGALRRRSMNFNETTLLDKLVKNICNHENTNSNICAYKC